MQVLQRNHLRVGLAFAVALTACSRNPRPAAPTPQPRPRPRAAQPQPAPTPAPAPAPAPAQPPAAAAPAPAPAPAPAARFVLTGDWDWSAEMGGETYTGTMSFQPSGTGYAGTMRVVGQFDATVRSATVTGDIVRVVYDSPQGEMVMDAVFSDANTLAGRVDVPAMSATASISARRR